jgi:hypothetical protein
MPLTTLGRSSDDSPPTVVGLRVVRPITMNWKATTCSAICTQRVTGVTVQNVASPAAPRAWA